MNHEKLLILLIFAIIMPVVAIRAMESECSSLEQEVNHFAALSPECIKYILLLSMEIDKDEPWVAIKNLYRFPIDGYDTCIEPLAGAGTQLINAQIDSNSIIQGKNYRLYTPLRFAAENGHLLCIEKLITLGADVTLKNQALKNPIALAREKAREYAFSYTEYDRRIITLLSDAQRQNKK